MPYDPRYNGPAQFKRGFIQGGEAATHGRANREEALTALIRDASADNADDFDKGYALGFAARILTERR